MQRVDQALVTGDFATFLALHADDAVIHVPGNSTVAGDHYGRKGLAAAFEKEMSLLDAPSEMVMLDNLGSDDHAAAVMIERMQRNRRSYAGMQVIVARVIDEQLAEVWFRPEDQQAFDDFFA
jgi:ketosteroid isomerase-like protein